MGNAESRPPSGGASPGTPQRKGPQQHPRGVRSGAGTANTTENTSSPNSKSKHTRQRSSTVTAASSVGHDSNSNSTTDNMGNEASAPRPSSRADIAPPATNTTAAVAEQAPFTQPLAIPAAATPAASEGQQDPVLSPAYHLPPAEIYSRPPRLPLPIEEEDHMPGSPILAAQDIPTPLDQNDLESGTIPRKSSVLSSTTVEDDEDMENNDAFPPDASRSLQVKVPTRMEWNGPGEKVFVTGTFCNWEKKMKLHRNKDKDRVGFSANIMLPPGTHHIKFLVDGDMTTSNELPTTVDWTNILVNYVEIVAPLPPETEDEKQPPAPAEPMPIPGAIASADQPGDAVRPLPYRSADQASGPDADLAATLEDVGPKGEADSSSAAPTSMQGPDQQKQPVKESDETVANVPRPKYTNKIPKFLLDLDNYSQPDDENFQRAQRVAGILPPPPSLPMFLSKSILNGNTPHKDDASVLIMPNHTVLNHLATSSIKSGVLATSGTTRYKRKFLTTIMYKPTSDAG